MGLIVKIKAALDMIGYGNFFTKSETRRLMNRLCIRLLYRCGITGGCILFKCKHESALTFACDQTI